MWAKWEDRQRLERQGDEIMEMARRREEEKEEKRRQAEGMTAGNEYRMMLMAMSKSYFQHHRLRLFNMVITPTLSYASGTWTLSKQHERMIRSTQRKMLRLIIQTTRKYEKKTQTTKNGENGEEEKANHRDADAETAEGSSTNTDCDQDSDVSFMKDSIDTVETEEVEWIEYMKRSKAIAIERMKAAKSSAGLKHTEE